MEATAGKKEAVLFLTKHPGGLLSIRALDVLRDKKPVLAPAANVAGPIGETLNKFPMEWLSIVDQPQNFYMLRGEPLKVPHAYGEPMLARITIQNISNFPITIGSDGVLHPDLWIDAQVRGAMQATAPQSLSGTAFDRMGHELI